MADVTKNAEDAMKTLADVRENVLDVMGKNGINSGVGNLNSHPLKQGNKTAAR